MKRTLLLLCVTVLQLSADGALQMKGFHHDLPLEDACHIMSTFKSERGNFIFKPKQKKCGFGRHGFITYPCIIGKKDTAMVDSIILSPDVVNTLFDAEKMKANVFIRSFCHKYHWVNTFYSTGTYRQESKKFGWTLTINKKKWIKISFFEKDGMRKEKNKSEKTLKTIPIY
jgi:hypothetical protein